MAFTLIQAGTSLQLLDTSGAIATLTLPTGVSLNANARPRFTVFQSYAVVTNSPTRPLTVDGNGTVRVLSPTLPNTVLATSGVTSGGLTGTYLVRQSFYIKDAVGNIISESGLGPSSVAVTIAAKKLRVANLAISPDAVTGTRLYRTVTNGTVFFPWLDLDGNIQTSVEDDAPDAALGTVAAPSLGTAPDMMLVVNFKSRLFGVDRSVVDQLRYTESGSMYQWPGLNTLGVDPVGSDSRGVTGLISRRDALGIGRRDKLRQLTGTSLSDFAVVNLSENVGIESHETIQIVNDIAFWLWKDGVYKWDADGLSCVSDGNPSTGKGRVRSWFNTNAYFNRAQFVQAFAVILPDRYTYRLFLCSAGSTTIDRFVDYDIKDGSWWGPHKTGEFTPTCALVRANSNGILGANVGSASGYLYQEQATRTDGTSTAIDFDVDTNEQDCQEPTVEKTFCNLRVANQPQTTGRLIITPSVGELNAVAATRPLQMDLTDAQKRIGHIGRGKTVTLNFREATAGQDVQLLGYEIDTNVTGHRG